MVEKINTKSFHIVSNHVLIKVDPDYDFKDISGPNGTVISLQLPYYSEHKSEYQSITGIVIGLPEAGLVYRGDIKTETKGVTIASDEHEAIMRSSMPWKTDLAVTVGDRVVFDYKQGLSAETDGKLLQDENGGYLLLLDYSAIFCVLRGDDVIPVNGWVIFIRDQSPSEYLSNGGVWVIEKVNKYGIQKATVVSSDKCIEGYLEVGRENEDNLPKGTRILIQQGFGYRIACDTHGGIMQGWECVHRKNILAIIS